MDFFTIIQSLQDLVYEIVVWVMLLPKTFFRAVFRPGLMVQYVNQEWKKEPEKQFDEYLSPVLFFLIVAVIPNVLLNWGNQPAGGWLAQLTESNITAYALGMLIVFFIYLTWLEWLNKNPIKRSGLKRLFYIQCYLIAPAQFIYILLLSFGAEKIGLANIGILSPLILIFYQSFAFQDELKVRWLKGLWLAALPQIVLFVLVLIAAIVALVYFDFQLNDYLEAVLSSS